MHSTVNNTRINAHIMRYFATMADKRDRAYTEKLSAVAAQVSAIPNFDATIDLEGMQSSSVDSLPMQRKAKAA